MLAETWICAQEKRIVQSTSMRKITSEDSDVQEAPSTSGSDAMAEAVAAAAAVMSGTDSDGSDTTAEAVAVAIGSTDSDGNSNEDDDNYSDSSSGGSNGSEKTGSPATLTFQDRIDDCLAVRTHHTRHARTRESCRLCATNNFDVNRMM